MANLCKCTCITGSRYLPAFALWKPVSERLSAVCVASHDGGESSAACVYQFPFPSGENWCWKVRNAASSFRRVLPKSIEDIWVVFPFQKWTPILWRRTLICTVSLSFCYCLSFFSVVFRRNVWLGQFWLCILQLHILHVCYFSRGIIASFLYSTARSVNGEAICILSSRSSAQIYSKWANGSLLLFGLFFVKSHLSYCWSKSTLFVSCQVLSASLDLNLRIGWHRRHSYYRLPVHQSRHWLQCSISCRKVVHYPITAIHRITTQRDTKHTKSFHSVTQLELRWTCLFRRFLLKMLRCKSSRCKKGKSPPPLHYTYLKPKLYFLSSILLLSFP